MGLIVAIDGPAGAGKSSVAAGVADELGFTRVDTGAMYRAVTLVAKEQGVEDAEGLSAVARALPLHFEGRRVFLGEREVTDAIRSQAVTEAVSAVSAVAGVRGALLGLQRRLGRAHDRGAVLEGRDIGTVVFPDAEVKVYLTASNHERARRRHAELVAAGRSDTLEQVLDSIRARDLRDGSRTVAPLRAAADAIRVDTTEKKLAQVVEEVVAIVRGADLNRPTNEQEAAKSDHSGF